MAKAKQRIVFGALFVLLGALLFWIASAYVVDHDYNRIAAAIVGGLAFPVLPVVWHVIGERRRRTKVAAMKQAPKTTLAATDRYWLRFTAVALVVLGPMI